MAKIIWFSLNGVKITLIKGKSRIEWLVKKRT